MRPGSTSSKCPSAFWANTDCHWFHSLQVPDGRRSRKTNARRAMTMSSRPSRPVLMAATSHSGRSTEARRASTVTSAARNTRRQAARRNRSASRPEIRATPTPRVYRVTAVIRKRHFGKGARISRRTCGAPVVTPCTTCRSAQVSRDERYLVQQRRRRSASNATAASARVCRPVRAIHSAMARCSVPRVIMPTARSAKN